MNNKPEPTYDWKVVILPSIGRKVSFIVQEQTISDMDIFIDRCIEIGVWASFSMVVKDDKEN